MNKKLNIIEYRKRFYKLYQDYISPEFKKYENKRKSSLFTGIVVFLFFGILAVCFTWGFFAYRDSYLLPEFRNIIAFLILGSAIIFWVFTVLVPASVICGFTDDLKAQYMEKILKVFGEICWHNGKEIITNEELRKSELFATFNKREFYDGFSGVYKDVPFEISETKLLCESSSKEKYKDTVFEGVIVKLGINKTFTGKTSVTTRGDKIKELSPFSGVILIGYLFFGLLLLIISGGICFISFMIYLVVAVIILLIYLLSRSFEISKKQVVLNEMNLEDPEFSKKYKVSSTSQVEGRYLITPAFMERFKNFQTAFGTGNVKCSFYDNSLMFAISTNKNVFELGSVFQPLTDPKTMQQFFEEIISIYLMIDYFKLDENTGL